MSSRAIIPRIRFSQPLSFHLRRPHDLAARRSYSTEPPAPAKQPTRTGTFYKSFGSPILKCFLGALFTYQVTYWAWMKLEMLEEKMEMDDEVAGLKQELRREVEKQKEARLREGGAEVVAAGQDVKEKKKGWSW